MKIISKTMNKINNEIINKTRFTHFTLNFLILQILTIFTKYNEGILLLLSYLFYTLIIDKEEEYKIILEYDN